MPVWHGDWHTTAPIIYTVRHAGENGWKWSGNGAQGYAGSADAAKAAAQADYEARVHGALVLPVVPTDVAQMIAELRSAKPDEQCNDSKCRDAADTIEALVAQVERAFRDGLTYGTICDVTDQDEAWRTSQARARLQTSD